MLLGLLIFPDAPGLLGLFRIYSHGIALEVTDKVTVPADLGLAVVHCFDWLVFLSR